MSEPIVIYRVKDGKEVVIASPSYAAELIASGEYSDGFVSPPQSTGGAEKADVVEPAPPVEGKGKRKR